MDFGSYFYFFVVASAVAAVVNRIHQAEFEVVYTPAEVFVAESATAILNNSDEREAVSEEILVAAARAPERQAVEAGLIDTLKVICLGFEERFRAGEAGVLVPERLRPVTSVVRGVEYEIEVALLETAHWLRIVTYSV